MSHASEEEDRVHPIVSNLLGQKFVPRLAGETFRYDRDEMMKLKVTPLSTTRPDNLSTDFDGDDGKFSPYKWLEYRWEVEGIKNRLPNKKLQDALRADCDENSGLSPQRRGFSGGCRAPPSEDKKETGVDKVPCKDEGWSTVETRDSNRTVASNPKWKSSTSSDKFTNGKSNDFKLPFQKSTTTTDKNGRLGSWKTVEGKEKQSGSFSTTGKFIPARNYRGDDRPEKLPEWADGPTTMDDMIELKGFEEPAKGKKKNGKVEKPPAKGEKEKNSRPNSRGNASGSNSADPSRGPDQSQDIRAPLPTTDHELAAILGLLDLPPSGPPGISAPSQSNAPSSSLTGSRMSRFFNKNAQAPSTTTAPGADVTSSAPGISGEPATNPLLAKIMSQTSTGSSTPGNSTKAMPPAGGRTMHRLEDLERNIVQNNRPDQPPEPKPAKMDEHAMKGNPLQDPHQQAHLLQRLQKMAKQQEEANNGAPKLPPQQQPGYPAPPFPMPGMHPQIAPEHILVAQAQQIVAMQLQQMFPGGVPSSIPPQQLDRMRNEVMRGLIVRHATMTAAIQQQQQQAASQQQQAKHAVRPPTMIPSSVQRHMTKASTAHSEDKREKEREGEDPEGARGEAIKKMQMHQQYNALMSAMQNGLPMAAVRPGAPHPQMANPTPQQLQAFMIQQAQAQRQQEQLRLAYLQKQQQQEALMKLMAMQQQQQVMQQLRGEPEGSAHHSNGNVPHLLQVGPIQTPLEKLLTAAGVQPSQFTGSSEAMNNVRSETRPVFPGAARPMSHEELERQLTEKSK